MSAGLEAGSGLCSLLWVNNGRGREMAGCRSIGIGWVTVGAVEVAGTFLEGLTCTGVTCLGFDVNCDGQLHLRLSHSALASRKSCVTAITLAAAEGLGAAQA